MSAFRIGDNSTMFLVIYRYLEKLVGTSKPYQNISDFTYSLI